MVNYKIVNFNASSGQIIVEYGPKLDTMTIDVPIVDGLFMAGEELLKYVEGMIPTWHFERLAQLEAGIPNANDILGLVQEPTPVPEVEFTSEVIEATANQQMWAQIQFEKQLAKALVKFGVLETDPTAIQVSAQ
jgi:hypothetical protein